MNLFVLPTSKIIPIWQTSRLILLVALIILFPRLSHASRQVTLAWEASQDVSVVGYRMFYRQAGTTYNYTQPVWEGLDTICTVYELDEYTDFAFVVRAYDSNGNMSTDSNEVWLFGQTALPLQPQATSPENNAEDIFLTPVLQATPFSSPDASDNHLQTQWIVTRVPDDLCVLDITSSRNLTELDVPPLLLEDNTRYSWVIRHYGSKGSLSDWSSPISFTTGDSGLDVDGNGIPDDQEVGMAIDLDRNNIPDADQDDIRCVTVLGGMGQMAVCASPGIGVTGIVSIESTDLASIGSKDQFPYDLPLGLVSLRLEMNQVGGIGLIRIHFQEPAPYSATWVKHDAFNGWQDYSAHAVFADDRLSVEIALQDGGFGDADGVANGIVIDPSGYGIATGGATDSAVDSHETSPSAAVGAGVSSLFWGIESGPSYAGRSASAGTTAGMNDRPFGSGLRGRGGTAL